MELYGERAETIMDVDLMEWRDMSTEVQMDPALAPSYGDKELDRELLCELIGSENAAWGAAAASRIIQEDMVEKARSTKACTKRRSDGRIVGNRFELQLSGEEHNVFAYSDCSSLIKGEYKEAAAAAAVYTDGLQGVDSRYREGWTTGLGEVMGLGMALRLSMDTAIPDDKPSVLRVFVDSEYVFNSIAKGWLYKWVNTPEDAGRIIGYNAWLKIHGLLSDLNSKYNTVLLYHVRSHVWEFGNTVVDLIAHETRVQKGLGAGCAQFITMLFGKHVPPRYSKIYKLPDKSPYRKLS